MEDCALLRFEMLDHSYESSSKLHFQVRPIRTYKRSNKPLLPKEIKLEPNIKLEQDIEIVDDYTTQADNKDQTESDNISIQQTYPPEMLVINIKEVMTATNFDPDLLSAVKHRSISTSVTAMKSGGPGKVWEATKSELSEERVKSVLPAEPKRPEVSSEAVLLKPKSPEAVLRCPVTYEGALVKPKNCEAIWSPEVQLNMKNSETVLVNPKSFEALAQKPECPDLIVLNPKRCDTTLAKQNKSEAPLLKLQSAEMVQPSPKSSETIEVNQGSSGSPELVVLNSNISETMDVNRKNSEAQPLKPMSSQLVLLNPKSSGTVLDNRTSSETVLLKPESPEVVLPSTESPEIVLVKRINKSEAVQVKPNCSQAFQPKQENSEAAQLRLASPEAVQSKSNLNSSTANVPEVVHSITNTLETAQWKQSIHDKLLPLLSMAAKERVAEALSMIVDEWSDPELTSVKPDLTEVTTVTTSSLNTRDEVQGSEATLVKLKRHGETILLMSDGNKPLVKTPRILSPKPAPEEDCKTERPDEILEPKVIKLNLPEYVVDYEPNSNAPAVPPLTLLPLIPLPLPSIIDDEPPMIVDALKHLQEQLTPLLPRRWSLRVEKEGIFAMLFGPGLTCAVQRAVYAAYDGSELKFIVHGKVIPEDHSVYEYRLMKTPLPLSVETVRDFADVVMGAIHSVIQHHVCMGINDEQSMREYRNHPGCRMDDNFFGEEGYTKTLRSIDCAYLVWRKNTKRCSECVFFRTLWRNRIRRRPARVQEREAREPKSRKTNQ